ncbi:hypothetical protein UJ101_02387 [Flavobacteriaceae bacterium UJ101]|nr:hypothetical protein UJ101_02387 [Flavobacteriaceae bacterium UJ101]
MKSFSFKNKGSIIRTIEEPKVKKKVWTFDRITYWLVILIISFFISRFVYNTVNIIKGNGQIVFEKLAINFTDDIRLEELYIQEGEKINIGDTLFSYLIENNQSNHELNIQKAQIKSKLAKDLISIEKEIMMKKALLKGIQTQLKLTQNSYNKLIKMVLLEINSYEELQNIKSKQTLLKSKKTILQEEIIALKKLKNEYSKTSDDLITYYFPQKKFNYYIAKQIGISGTTNFSNGEVCYRQQEVLTIHNPKKVQIRAYFSQNYAQYVTEGTIVQIKFPNGTYSNGKIVHSYISTYALPSEFQKKYEPTERSILVDIEPINQNEATTWGKFYLMDVKLVIKRFF